MPTIHPKARTTPAVRAEIARSIEPTGVLARRYGVSTETIRKWRKRGAADCQDHSSRPHKLPWKATEEERAIVCALRRGNYSPPHRDAFLLLNQQLTPLSSRCRVESKCRRDVSRAASRDATLVVSSGTLLERYWSEAEHLSNGLGSGI